MDPIPCANFLKFWICSWEVWLWHWAVTVDRHLVYFCCISILLILHETWWLWSLWTPAEDGGHSHKIVAGGQIYETFWMLGFIIMVSFVKIRMNVIHSLWSSVFSPSSISSQHTSYRRWSHSLSCQGTGGWCHGTSGWCLVLDVFHSSSV